MSRSSLQDPLKKFSYRVIIPGMRGTAAFTEVTGLKMTMAVDSIRGGGENHSVQKSPGLPDFPNISLKRGVIIDTQNQLDSDGFLNWSSQLFHWQAVGYADREFRREVRIQLLRRAGLVARTWIVRECWVADYEAFEDLQGGETGNLFETIELVHEGFGHTTQISPPPLGGTLNPVLGIGV